MKEAIEKAVENGFDLNKLFPASFPIELGVTPIGSTMFNGSSLNIVLEYYLNRESFLSINMFELIFGTDFIDKLVGGKQLCLNTVSCLNKSCRCLIKDMVEKRCYSICGEDWLGEIRFIADYHRQRMASIKDVEKLKQYINNKIMEGR